MNERQPGYYRVKLNGKWHLAYTENGSLFWINGIGTAHVAEKLDEIDETPIPAEPKEITDATRELLDEICKWELDLGNPYALESILREKFTITMRDQMKGGIK